MGSFDWTFFEIKQIDLFKKDILFWFPIRLTVWQILAFN